MRILYLDEAGDAGTLTSPTNPNAPVFVIAGIVVEHIHLSAITHDFLDLKVGFFSGATTAPHRLDAIQYEVKGADLRGQIRSGSRRQRTHALGFLDGIVRILARYQAKVLGRVWIKAINVALTDRSVYSYSVQSLCASFQNLLEDIQDYGLIIADSRRKNQNVYVSHSIFTQMYKWFGNPYPRLMEMPTFGHAANHALIQMADLLCSALLFPMATHSYCRGHIDNVHVSEEFLVLKTRYGPLLAPLQYRYRDAAGKWRGGITVSDALEHRNGSVLFR